jgi:tripartite-type tricarboxylate transporter receptor subunit TctC
MASPTYHPIQDSRNHLRPKTLSYETFSPTISASGRGRGSAGHVKHRLAQAYPARPVRIIVGFPPGGGSDIFARLIGQWLSERLGRPFIVDNRPGAGSNIGAEAVVRAPADGYTPRTCPT